MLKGDFTLPGEAGCEELTLKLARKWGADVIRDSDGTKLSPELLNAGYDIYSKQTRSPSAFTSSPVTMRSSFPSTTARRA